MKNLIIISLVVLFGTQINIAQDTMYVWLKNGNVSKYAVAQIDYIIFHEPENLQDIDGNTYKVVTIGTQTWMAENLKVTKYRNGDLIGTTSPETLNITPEDHPKYQWIYNGNEAYANEYGRLYTWYAVTDSRNVCPSGWHLPNNAEWETLINYIADPGHEGAKLKETGTDHWETPNQGATNATGFTALPGGIRTPEGIFENLFNIGSWWSAESYNTTNAASKNMSYATESVDSFGTEKSKGLSVRCVKD